MPLIDTSNLYITTYCRECDDELESSWTLGEEEGDTENPWRDLYVTVSPCRCQEPDCDEAWSDGFSCGKDEGLSEGFIDGKEEGLEEANCVGRLIRKTIAGESS